jgi:hypothetical protein
MLYPLELSRKSFFGGVISLLDNIKKATTNNTTFFMGKNNPKLPYFKGEKKVEISIFRS